MPEAEDSGLRNFLSILRRRLWLVLAIVLTCVGVAMYRMSKEVPEYRATALIRLVDARGAVGGTVVEGGVPQMGRGAEAIQSEILVLRNSDLLAGTVGWANLQFRSLTPGFSVGQMEITMGGEAAGAQGVPTFRGTDTLHLSFSDGQVSARRANHQASAGYGIPLELGGVQITVNDRPAVDAAALTVVSRESAMRTLASGLRARPVEGTNGITLDFTSPDPDFALRAANGLAVVYQSWRTSTSRQQAQRRRIFLEEQVQSTDSLLVGAQLALSQFRSQRGIFRSEQQVTAQQAELLQLDIRRGDLEADRRLYQSLLSELRRPRQANRAAAVEALVSAPGIMANPAVAQFFQQVSQYERERTELTAGEWRRSDTHPDVRRLDALIEQAEERLAAAVQSHITSLQARIGTLDELRSQRSSVQQGLPDVEAEEFRLAQQVATLQQVGDQLRAEYQRARITEAVEAGPVEIVQLAGDVSRLSGGGIRTILMGLILGLALGSGAAVTLERMNTSIRRREDIPGVLRIPELAVIPPIRDSGMGRLRLPYGRRLTGQAQPANGNGKDAEKLELSSRELVTASSIPTLGAEAYRTLRTNLIFSQSVQALKTVVITSALKGEGKTTTACNLAITVAQQGRRVLVVDCDLRRPGVHKLFWLSPEPGLSDVLSGDNPLHECIRSTAITGLSVLPVGTLPSGPSELLGSLGMTTLLESLVEDYDMVILDTPPVLAVPDATILATQAHGVVLVVRAGHTDRATAQQAMQRLTALGGNVLGAVLNDPDVKVVHSGGYYDYHYYSSQYV